MYRLGPIADRMRLLLYMGDGADVHFLVGDKNQKVLAHKLILAASSDVFKAMFRFDQQNATHNSNPPPAKRAKETEAVVLESKVGVTDNIVSVEVPDVTYEAFMTMLDFIYSDDLDRLNGDNLFDVLYTAKKYQITLLAEACVAFPVCKIQNLFTAYAKARFYEEEDFAGRCLNNIDLSNERFLQDFLEIDQQLLCEILEKLRQIPGGEIAIWNAALRWADNQCRQNAKECTGENRREMLGPVLYKIRFRLIPQDYFSNTIVPTAVLTNEEMVNVFLSYSRPAAPAYIVGDGFPGCFPLQFSTQQRMAVGMQMPSALYLSTPSTAVGMHSGKLTLEIVNFSQFFRDGKKRNSDVVNIRGFLWKIYALPEHPPLTTSSSSSTTLSSTANVYKKNLGLYFHCEGPENNEPNWCCTISATMQIVSKKGPNSGTSFVWIRHLKDQRFGTLYPSCGWADLSFEQVMNPVNGWYNRMEDTLTLAAEVYPYTPKYPLSWSSLSV